MTGKARRRPGRKGRGLVVLFLTAAAGSVASCGGESGSVETRIVLLGTNDVHGHLLPWDYALARPADHSLAHLATLIDSVRSAERHVLLLDSGDLLQGTPLDDFQAHTGPDSIHPVIASMNRLRYDAAAVGNHEFNYGIPYLERVLAGARFPFLAANIAIATTGEPFLPPDTILVRGGVRVGILGLTTPGVMLWDRTRVEGRLTFGDLVESARPRVEALRRRGADVVVVLAHSGLGPGSSYGELPGVPEENAVARLAREVPGIDVIFAGHTRAPIDSLRIGGTLILHTGAHASHLAVAELWVRRTPAGATVRSRGRLLRASDATPDSAFVASLTDIQRRTLAWLDLPIGFTPDRWDAAEGRVEDTPIADLIARVQADVTGAELSAVSIFRPGSRFGPGPITRRDVLGLYVYPNTLRAVKISGADLLAYLEWSGRYFGTYPSAPAVDSAVQGYDLDIVDGVDYVLDLSRPVGARVLGLRFRGRPVAPGDTFTLALNSYRQAGGGGYAMLAGAPVVYRDEIDIPTHIIAWIEARDTVRTEDVFRRNWEIRPAAARARLRSSAVAR